MTPNTAAQIAPHKEQLAGYLSVSLESIPIDLALPYGVYLFIGEKLTRFRNAGDQLPSERAEKLRQHGVDTVYLDKKEWQTYILSLEKSLDAKGIEAGNEKAAMGLRNVLCAYFKMLEEGREVQKDQFGKMVSHSSKLPVAIGQSRKLAHQMLRRSNDPSMYFSNHAVNLAIYATAIGLKLRMAGTELEDLVLAATFANIGIIRIPEEILYKPGPLSPDEWKIIRQHPQHGRDILSTLLMKPTILDAVGQHHEKMDGGGYPKGMVGQTIHLYARIIAIAECYSALTSTRPWKAASSPHEAVSLMQRTQGKFDNSLFGLLVDK